MMECCAGALECVDSPVEDVYILVSHILLPFNQMAQQHHTERRPNWGGVRVHLGVQMVPSIFSTSEQLKSGK